MRRQILTDDSMAVQVLRIPHYYQANSDWLCFVFSLKMCPEYFKNIYRNEFVRNSTSNLSIDELKQWTNSGEFKGTRIANAIMNELTRKIPSINFTLNEECSIDHLKRNFKNDMILDNLWLGLESIVKWKDFPKVCEFEYNKVVVMEPVTQTRLEVN